MSAGNAYYELALGYSHSISALVTCLNVIKKVLGNLLINFCKTRQKGKKIYVVKCARHTW